MLIGKKQEKNKKSGIGNAVSGKTPLRCMNKGDKEANTNFVKV